MLTLKLMRGSLRASRRRLQVRSSSLTTQNAKRRRKPKTLKRLKRPKKPRTRARIKRRWRLEYKRRSLFL